MRLVKTHSHTSEPQGREAGKVRNKLVKGRPSLEAQEQIVKENHRHVTRDGGGGEEDTWESESWYHHKKKNNTEDVEESHRKPGLQLTLETCLVPQTSDRITQTSPDTERGG